MAVKGSPGNSKVEEERPVPVDRDGGRSQGELLGEKAVGRVEAPLIHLGPWEPRRLRRRGASFTQAIFVTETLARDLVAKIDGIEVGPPAGAVATTREDTGEVTKNIAS